MKLINKLIDRISADLKLGIDPDLIRKYWSAKLQASQIEFHEQKGVAAAPIASTVLDDAEEEEKEKHRTMLKYHRMGAQSLIKTFKEITGNYSYLSIGRLLFSAEELKDISDGHLSTKVKRLALFKGSDLDDDAIEKIRKFVVNFKIGNPKILDNLTPPGKNRGCKRGSKRGSKRNKAW